MSFFETASWLELEMQLHGTVDETYPKADCKIVGSTDGRLSGIATPPTEESTTEESTTEKSTTENSRSEGATRAAVIAEAVIAEAARKTATTGAAASSVNGPPNYHSFTTPLASMDLPYPSRVLPSRPVVDSVIDLIGNTPMLRLRRIEDLCNLDCQLYAKLENMSAGGAVKDRIARRMIERAEEAGELLPGDMLIEASSGNTGIGFAMCAAVKGYKMVVVMPDKMSQEKANVLVALGAHVIRTPITAKWSDPNSHLGTAFKLRALVNANSAKFGGVTAHILDQYSAVGNTEAHMRETADEIRQQMNDKFDYFVAAVGTGGTFSGVTAALKKTMAKPPVCVAVDPEVSVMHIPKYAKKEPANNKQTASNKAEANTENEKGTDNETTNAPVMEKAGVEKAGEGAEEARPVSVSPLGVDERGVLLDLSDKAGGYEVEGIGYDFHPATFHFDLADRFELVNDRQSFEALRMLIRHEGVLAGGSSGAALAASIRLAKTVPPKSTIVMILPDSVRNYVNKLLAPDWLLLNHQINSYNEHPKYQHHLDQVQHRLDDVQQKMNQPTPSPPKTCKAMQIDVSSTLADCYAKMCANVCGDSALVRGCEGELRGMISRKMVERKLLELPKNARVEALVPNAKSIHILPDAEGAENLAAARLILTAVTATPECPAVVISHKPENPNEENDISAYYMRVLPLLKNDAELDVLVLESFLPLQ